MLIPSGIWWGEIKAELHRQAVGFTMQPLNSDDLLTTMHRKATLSYASLHKLLHSASQEHLPAPAWHVEERIPIV
jgi:hypothetical protein